MSIRDVVLVNYFIASNILILFRFQRFCEAWLLNDKTRSKKYCINEVIVSTIFPLTTHFLPMLHTVSDEPSGLEAPTVAIFCASYYYSQICRVLCVPRTTNLSFSGNFLQFTRNLILTRHSTFIKHSFSQLKTV